MQNQDQVWLPQNDITVNLWYNQRMIIDSRAATQGLDAYLTWNTTKVESTFPPGVLKITMKQDLFDDNRDKFDPVTGYLYADYDTLADEQSHESDVSTGNTSSIIYKGSPTVRVAGTGKNVSLKFYDKDNIPVEITPASTNLGDYWSFKILNADGTEYETSISAEDILSTVNDDVFTVKIKTDSYDLIGKQLELHGHNADGSCDSSQIFSLTSL